MTICDRCKRNSTNTAPVGRAMLVITCERLIGVNKITSEADLCHDCLAKLGNRIDTIVASFCDEPGLTAPLKDA